MFLLIDIPQNIRKDELIKQQDIPCFCKVSNQFILTLDFDPFILEGEVIKWDKDKLSLMYPSGVGGEYIYYTHAMISISKILDCKYKIESLEFFNSYSGWCSIVINGEYAPEKEYDEKF